MLKREYVEDKRLFKPGDICVVYRRSISVDSIDDIGDVVKILGYDKEKRHYHGVSLTNNFFSRYPEEVLKLKN